MPRQRAGWIALVALLAGTSVSAQADPSVNVALEALRAKAAAGNPIAQFSLGSILYYGTKDTARSVEWIRQAAAQGFPSAEWQLAQLYDFGFGVRQDDREAFRWYRKAAEHAVPAAQRALGDFYQKGRVVPPDAGEAARWYRQAAEADDLRAQYQLGQLYFDGAGVARDYVSAYVWFAIAAGQTPLIDNRKQLIELRHIAAARMTRAQVTEAVRRVAAWRPPGPSP